MGTIVTMKWGTRYGPQYVNYVYESVSRHSVNACRFVCFTDDPDGLAPGVEIHPLPDLGLPPGAFKRGAWPKLGVFHDSSAELKGPCLFLDLDVVIVGSIDCFFGYRSGEFCLIRDWEHWHQRVRNFRKPRIGNTSVFRFEGGTMRNIAEIFISQRSAALAQFRNEQRFLSYHATAKCWWPRVWVSSFKRHCIPVFPANLALPPRIPKESRIIAFHGRPNPHEALAGYRKGPIHRWVQPTPWIGTHWRNGVLQSPRR